MSKLVNTSDYKDFIQEIKSKIQSSQIKAALKVNEELLKLYWDLGERIVEKQKSSNWGDGLIMQISKDLKDTFPNLKGFSSTNIKYMRQWYLFFANGQQVVDQLDDGKKEQLILSQLGSGEKAPQIIAQIEKKPAAQTEEAEKSPQVVDQIVQQAVAQLFKIPWGHNIAIISKVKNIEEALFYVNHTIENNWSRAVLVHQIESDLYHRKGKAVTNFKTTLPAPQSDLAHQLLKDPYTFDFLNLQEKHNEKELEGALTDHVAKFLMELGTGFSYIGRQYRIEVDREEFFMDLLFYHVKLHCYVVIDLKKGKFIPEYAGKINFYISAIDEQIKDETDNPTIGILICKSKNNTVVEYAIKDIHKPIGVSEYIITKELPENLRFALPSIEEIEAKLGNSNE